MTGEAQGSNPTELTHERKVLDFIAHEEGDTGRSEQIDGTGAVSYAVSQLIDPSAQNSPEAINPPKHKKAL